MESYKMRGVTLSMPSTVDPGLILLVGLVLFILFLEGSRRLLDRYQQRKIHQKLKSKAQQYAETLDFHETESSSTAPYPTDILGREEYVI